jgi:hypothetical protein
VSFTTSERNRELPNVAFQGAEREDKGHGVRERSPGVQFIGLGMQLRAMDPFLVDRVTRPRGSRVKKGDRTDISHCNGAKERRMAEAPAIVVLRTPWLRRRTRAAGSESSYKGSTAMLGGPAGGAGYSFTKSRARGGKNVTQQSFELHSVFRTQDCLIEILRLAFIFSTMGLVSRRTATAASLVSAS